MTTTACAHIVLDEAGIARIAGTGVKVLLLAMEHRLWSWDAAEIQAAHDGLTPGQLHSALAYYYDHRDAVDRQIDEPNHRAEALQRTLGDSPEIERLRLLKRSR